MWKPLPNETSFDPQVSPDDPEVRKVTVLASTSAEHSDLIDDIKHFSDWFHAKRVIALCVLFSQKMKLSLKKDSTNSAKEEDDSLRPNKERKRQDGSLRSITLRVKDLQTAELFLIKAAQSKAFPEETEALATKSHQENGIVGKSVKRTSPIHCLKPIVDDDGVLRVGGRLHQTELPYDVKHPVLLPKKAHLTDLVIRHFHQCTGHQGRARTHAGICSSGYWIVNGSSLIGHHISKCVTCRKLRASPQQQVMAELPTQIRASPSIHLQRCRLFWAILHKGRAQGDETIWSSVHLHGFTCHPSRDSNFVDN